MVGAERRSRREALHRPRSPAARMAREEGSGTVGPRGRTVPGGVGVVMPGGYPGGIGTGPNTTEGVVCAEGGTAEGGTTSLGVTTGTPMEGFAGAPRSRLTGTGAGGVAAPGEKVIAAPPTRAALPAGPSVSGSFRHTSRTIVAGDFGAAWPPATWPTPRRRRCRAGCSSLCARRCVVVQHWVMLKGRSGLLPTSAASLARSAHGAGEHFGTTTHGSRSAQRRNE